MVLEFICIEKYMKNQAKENVVGGDAVGAEDLVMRVNQDVFDLETMLYKGQGKNAVFAKGMGEGDGQVDGGCEGSWEVRGRLRPYRRRAPGLGMGFELRHSP